MVLETIVHAPPNRDYQRPHSLAEAVAAVSAGDTLILGGGTDIYPAHVGRPLPSRLVDVSAVAEMRGIVVANGQLRIGGAATWTEIAAAPLPPALLALQDAARQVGSLQVQNRGTIGGNLCNASPAADGVPPLLVLEAAIELASAAGLRQVPLTDFIAGYRKTTLRPGEVLSAIVVPNARAGGRSAFVKLGARKYMVISIVMAAALVRRDESGAIARVRVAVGSASERAQRLGLLERDLVGLTRRQVPSKHLRAEHFALLKPIDDVRATASYRLDVARHLVGEALDQAADGRNDE